MENIIVEGVGVKENKKGSLTDYLNYKHYISPS
jgi:hypothetical protein